MNDTDLILAFMKKEHPQAPVTCIPEKNPLEIIFELKKTTTPDQSVALAFIKESKLHYHAKTTEYYLVQQNQLCLHIGDEQTILSPGDSYTIPPNTIHWAEGLNNGQPGFAAVKIIAEPAWDESDHFWV